MTVDVVGYDIGRERDRARLRRIAEVTGGRYTDARDGAALRRLFNEEVARLRDLIDAQVCLVQNKVSRRAPGSWIRVAVTRAGPVLATASGKSRSE